MDKKLKMRKNVILYMFTMLAVLMGCFFYTPKEAHAAEPGKVQVSAAQMVTYSSDIPTEVTKPIEKLKKIVEYIVMAAGWVAFVVGGIMTIIAFFGHQNDIKIQSLIVLFAGLVIGVIPSLATWIMS